MTKEVAEKIVRGITDKIECNTADIDDWAEFWGFTRGEYEEFLDMAIKVIEQEPCEDCTVIKKISKKYYVEDAYGYTDEDIVNKVNEIIDAVNESSSITPQPKIGHWINLEETKYKGQVLPFWSRYECSKCGGHGEGTFNYCPNCGTKMEVEE